VEDERSVAVLLVDDDPRNLLALEEVLRPLGHTLVTARSGKEALRSLAQCEFAVVLLDVRMPLMDGFETAERIAELERARGTPIIFITAAATTPAQLFRGYAVGAVDYVTKPVEPEILRSKVSVFVELFHVRAFGDVPGRA
jgi:CheY-like chemotaxis protein